MFLTFVLSVDTTPKPPPPPILDTIDLDDDTIIDAMKEHVGAAATEVILRHPNQDLINLLMRGLCGGRFTGIDTERFACITRKYTDGLSGFVMTTDSELLAYFRIKGCFKSDEGSLLKLLPCRLPKSDDIFRASDDGLLVANNNLRVRFTTEEDLAAGRLTPAFTNAMNSDPTKKQALKDACDHSRVIGRAKNKQNLRNPSTGKLTVTCGKQFAGSQNLLGEYYRTFDSFKDFRKSLLSTAADKAFHITEYEKRRLTIAGTFMDFPAAHSCKTGGYPAFRITPHP